MLQTAPVRDRAKRLWKEAQRFTVLSETMVPPRKQNLKKAISRVPEWLLKDLSEAITLRRIDHGVRLLRRHRSLFRSCGPNQENSGILLGLLAKWVDMGFGQPELLRNLVKRFPPRIWPKLNVNNFVHLQVAVGFVNICDQEDQKAIRHCEVVLAIASEIADYDLMTIMNFWIGRCYRRQGRYDDALRYVVKAREIAAEFKHFKTVAVIQVLEGWVLHQQGRVREATKILREAGESLLQTDDYVTRGNLNSVYGRISRRRGDYEESLRYFQAATEEYKKRDEQHRNLARCLVNIAFAKRLIALELGNAIDSEALRKRRTLGKKVPRIFDSQPTRSRVRVLRQEAFRSLNEATRIYARHHDYSGLGNVEVSSGYIHLDDGALDLAASRAEKGFRLAEEKNDIVLKARARILQSETERAKAEEQIVQPVTPRQSSRRAVEYAQEAVRFAKETQSRPLIAQSLVTLGLAFLKDEDIDNARDCSDRAADLLRGVSREYVSRQYQTLNRSLAEVGTIEPVLREWSKGIVGNKTFRQITRDFEAFIIPKIWKRESCRVSGVAKQLSISPKKVRRILRSQGYIKGSAF
jgi:tetratricopeptide (TPR) repeat protein